MPVEFALRPRIRLREGFAPPKQRWRVRLPRFALPVLAYWGAIGGVCYGVVRSHDAVAPLGAAAPALDDEPSAARFSSQAQLEAAEPAPIPRDQAESPLAAEAPPLEPVPAAVPPAAALLASANAPSAPPAAVPAQTAQTARVQGSPNLGSSVAITDFGPDPDRERVAPRGLASASGAARGGGPLPSCEVAAAAAVQDLDFASSDRTADLPSSAIASVLENGAWFNSCAVPAATHLGICVAIKHGQVTAVTVVARPANAALEGCVAKRAAGLQFPYGNRLDIARTQF